MREKDFLKERVRVEKDMSRRNEREVLLEVES